MRRKAQLLAQKRTRLRVSTWDPAVLPLVALSLPPDLPPSVAISSFFWSAKTKSCLGLEKKYALSLEQLKEA